MSIVDHLRAVLATVNDKAYRSGPDQDAIEAARRALALLETGTPASAPAQEPTHGSPADQRAAFVKAMQDCPRGAPDHQGATRLGGGPEDAATGSVVRSTWCSEMEQVPG